MNLREGWLSKKRASFVSAIGRCDVAAASIGRQIEHVYVAAASEHDCIRRVPCHFSRAQVPSDDSLGLAIDDHQVEHLCVRKHMHSSRGDLAAQRLITA